MRMSNHTFEAIRQAIAGEDTPERRNAYKEGRFPNANMCSDKDMRYRWDLFWFCGGMHLIPRDEGLTDAHIDTALRAIVLKL